MVLCVWLTTNSVPKMAADVTRGLAYVRVFPRADLLAAPTCRAAPGKHSVAAGSAASR